jgi:RNA polymerase sigma factor (sigma-70 family)
MVDQVLAQPLPGALDLGMLAALCAQLWRHTGLEQRAGLASAVPAVQGPSGESPWRALSYLQRVRQLARHTLEQEQHCLRLLGGPDQPSAEQARHELVAANLWVVPLIVRRYYKQGPGFDDLVAEGNLGLYRALDGFDPSRGLRFSSYAKWWVVNAVTSAMAANAYPVRLPRKVAQAMSRAKRQDPSDLTDADVQSVADPMLEPQEASHEASHESAPEELSAHTLMALEPTGDSDEALLAEQCIDTDSHPDQLVAAHQLMQRLSLAVQALPERERFVIESRYGLNGREEATLQEIAEHLSISAEWVRRVQLQAMRALKSHIDLPAP